MLIQYNVQRLTELIRNLFDLTGISLSILDTEYQTLTHCSHPDDFCTHFQKLGIEGDPCKSCDERILKKCTKTRKLEGHICAAGLYDSAMPIIKHDAIVGYVIMGRVRSAKSPTQLAPICGIDDQTYEQLQSRFSQLPMLTKTQLQALYDLLPSILFDNAIQIVYDPLVNEIVRYVADHLNEPLSVQHLCEHFHISANHLYNAFRDNFGRTVAEYICDQRLRRAKNLLRTTNDPVYMIAENVGIGNYTYFCRLFKKHIGCTPAQFRDSARGC